MKRRRARRWRAKREGNDELPSPASGEGGGEIEAGARGRREEKRW